MAIATSVVLAAAAAAWCWTLIASLRTAAALPHLAPGPGTSARADWPTVEVVIPARDEAADIGDTLARFASSDYPGLGVIAVNDRSTDATGALMDAAASADPRVRVVHLDTLPEGWIGKVNAMAQATSIATADWLLFCDADVKFAPGAIATTVDAAERAGLDLLTAFPHMESMGLAADATMVAMSTLAMVGGRLWEAADPDKATVAGFGAFLLVRSAHLQQRTPGLEWLRLEVADDVGMGLLIKRHGGRIGVYNAASILSLRWYAGYREMARRMEKNWFVIMGRCSAARTAAIGLLAVVSGLAPLLVALPGLPWYGVVAGAIALVAQLSAALVFVRWLGRNPVLALTVPLGCVLVGAMAFNAAWRGGGREVCGGGTPSTPRRCCGTRSGCASERSASAGGPSSCPRESPPVHRCRAAHVDRALSGHTARAGHRGAAQTPTCRAPPRCTPGVCSCTPMGSCSRSSHRRRRAARCLGEPSVDRLRRGWRVGVPTCRVPPPARHPPRPAGLSQPATASFPCTTLHPPTLPPPTPPPTVAANSPLLTHPQT